MKPYGVQVQSPTRPPGRSTAGDLVSHDLEGSRRGVDGPVAIPG